jgi:hypothetical protein
LTADAAKGLMPSGGVIHPTVDAQITKTPNCSGSTFLGCGYRKEDGHHNALRTSKGLNIGKFESL